MSEPFRDLKITVEALPGSHIDRVCMQMAELSVRLKMRVTTKFNGATLIANPGDSAEKVSLGFDEWVRSGDQ